MNLKRLRLSLTLTAIAACYANMEAGIVKGKIFDASTAEPLIGASILANPGNRGSIVDKDGIYSIQLPEGTYKFAVKFRSDLLRRKVYRLPRHSYYAAHSGR